MNTILSFFLFAILQPHAWAIPEANFEAGLLDKVEPFFQQRAQLNTETVKREGGQNFALKYVFIPHPQSKGTVIIVNGLGETLLKYKEIFYDLYQEGYSIFSYDHHGQGLSQRYDGLTSYPESEKVYVENFSDYVDDLDHMVAKVAIAKLGLNSKPMFLLAHSMGGGISALYLSRNDFKPPFKAVVLDAPMLMVNTDLVSTIRASVESRISETSQVGASVRERLKDLNTELFGIVESLGPLSDNYLSLAAEMTAIESLGMGRDFAQDAKPCEAGEPPLISQVANPLTSSQARFNMKYNLRKQSLDLCMLPTYRWVGESLNATLRLQQRVVYAENLSLFSSWILNKPNLKMRILQAGRDTLVLPQGQNAFCRVQTDCKVIKMPFRDAQHEILIERDEIRNAALAEILKTFAP